MANYGNVAAGYKLVSDIPDALKCQICLSVVSQPLQHVTCGKLFCKVCLENLPIRQCPNCRTPDPRFFEDTRADREVRDLIVRCDCSWKGEWRSLEQHQDIDCGLTVLECKYKNIGCNARIKRINLEEHESDTGLHFQAAICLIARQQEQRARQQEQLARQQEQLTRQQEQLAMTQEKLSWTEYKLLTLQSQSHNGGHMIFKLTEYTQRKQNKEDYHSPHFYSGFYGYHFKLQVRFVIDTYLIVYAVIMEGDNDRKLKWPFHGSIAIQLLNQLMDGSHHNITADFRFHLNAVVGSYCDYIIPYSQLSCHNPVTNTQYLKDDTLYFRVQVQMPQDKPWLECGLID